MIPTKHFHFPALACTYSWLVGATLPFLHSRERGATLPFRHLQCSEKKKREPHFHSCGGFGWVGVRSCVRLVDCAFVGAPASRKRSIHSSRKIHPPTHSLTHSLPASQPASQHRTGKKTQTDGIRVSTYSLSACLAYSLSNTRSQALPYVIVLGCLSVAAPTPSLTHPPTHSLSVWL